MRVLAVLALGLVLAACADNTPAPEAATHPEAVAPEAAEIVDANALTLDQIIAVPMPLVPGDQMVANYTQVLTAGTQAGAAAPVGRDEHFVGLPFAPRGADRVSAAAAQTLDPTARPRRR